MNNLKALKKSVFYISFPFSIIGFLFPIYAYSKGATIREIGLVYSLFSLFTILMRPLVGRLIDKRGRKLGIVLGTIFYSFTNILYLLDKDFKYILIARIVQSIAASFFWISVNTIISDISSKDNQAENFGIMEQSLSKGNFLGATIGFNILFNNMFKDSFKILFIIYLGFSLISLYYAIFKLSETVEQRKTYEEEVIRNSRGFNIFLVIMAVFTLISSLTSHIYLIYLRENITEDFFLISCLYVPGAILSMFLPKKFGRISDRNDKKKIVFLGIFIVGILYLMFPLIKNYYYFMFINTLLSINGMFYGPAESALVMDIVGDNQRGKYYGRYRLALGIGGIIGPIIGTYIYEYMGNSMVFYIKGVLLMVFCVIVLRLFSIRMVYDDIKN